MASSLTQPTPITVPFAASGSKRTIPVASQIGVTDGQASYTDGYPPLCATPLASGGKPPSIQDMNGILNEITDNLRFLLGGGFPTFSATMAAAIGGYPVGAIIQDDARENLYQNVIDGNSVNFNTTPEAIGDTWLLCVGQGLIVPQASTTVAGKSELATDAETQTGTDTARSVTPANLSARTSTESRTGLVELATAAEALAGTDTARAVTPAGIRSALSASGTAPVYACRAWGEITITSGVPSLAAGGNVSSITDLGVGIYRANFTVAISDTLYAALATCDQNVSPRNGIYASTDAGYGYSSTTLGIVVREGSTSDFIDAFTVSFAIFR